MRFFGSLIFATFSNAIAILATAYFVRGFSFTGDFLDLAVTALLLAIINKIIRPVIKLLLGPLVVLTFGLFIVVVNALAIFLLDTVSASLTIQGLLPLLLSTLIIAIVNSIVERGAKAVSRN